MSKYVIGYTFQGKDYAIFLYYGAIGISQEMGKIFLDDGGKDDIDKYYKRAVQGLKIGGCTDKYNHIVKKEMQGGKVWIRNLASHKNPFLFLETTDPSRPRIKLKLK